MTTPTQEELSRKRCAPCEGGVPPLAPEEAQALAQSVEGWDVEPEGLQISRSWTVKNFMAGIEFFNKVAALAEEIARWLDRMPENEPIGVCFSGGIDSGSVFLTTYHVMKKRGMNLSRLKAFVLDLGEGLDVQQALTFLDSLGLGLFLETIEVDRSTLNVQETIRIVEDYKPLDVESATMATLILLS